MEHPTARRLQRSLLWSYVPLGALVVGGVAAAHVGVWPASVGVGVPLGVAALLVLAYEALVVRPLLRRTARMLSEALRRSETMQKEVERLEEARARAEAEGHAKSAFLASMSHEIRTPMSGVVGMASLLDDSRLDGAQRDFVQTIRTSSDMLVTLINDVLDLSKLEAGGVTVDVGPVALRPLVETAFDFVASRAAAKGVELIFAAAPGLPEVVETDATRLRQILVNLLANAVRHTEHGEVVVAARRAGAVGLAFDVRDTGEGISPGELQALFEPYHRGKSRAEGTGLGLYICKQLAELLGGTISARSLVGTGSTFTFSIAAPPAEAEAGAMEDARVEAQRGALHGRHALLAVPNRTLREALMVRLRSWGMEVEAVPTLGEGVALLEANAPCHAVLLDLGGEDAHAATLARIRHLRPGLPLVGMASLRQTAADLDLDACLAKPVKDARLRATLAELIAPTSVPGASADAPAGEAAHALRILLVEDNAINQKVALRLLQRLGYRADLATNGREAIEATQHTDYDVILMDVQMPVMDGVEATRAIREQQGSGPRIVALTASAMEGDRAYFLSVGMDDYLAKPVDLDALATMLQLPEDLAGTDARADDDRADDSTASLAAARAHREAAARFYRTLRTRLAQLVGGDDPAFTRDTLESFIASGPALLDEAEAALAQGDLDAARQAAQTLRSSATLLGAEPLVARCRTVEQGILADTLRLDDAAVQVHALRGLYQNLQHILRTILAEELAAPHADPASGFEAAMAAA